MPVGSVRLFYAFAAFPQAGSPLDFVGNQFALAVEFAPLLDLPDKLGTKGFKFGNFEALLLTY